MIRTEWPSTATCTTISLSTLQINVSNVASVHIQTRNYLCPLQQPLYYCQLCWRTGASTNVMGKLRTLYLTCLQTRSNHLCLYTVANYQIQTINISSCLCTVQDRLKTKGNKVESQDFVCINKANQGTQMNGTGNMKTDAFQHLHQDWENTNPFP